LGQATAACASFSPSATSHPAAWSSTRWRLPCGLCPAANSCWSSTTSTARTEAREAGGSGREIAELLAPDQDDYFLLKPKQSAFFGTPLELLLQHLQAKKLLLTGVASDQCVLVTAAEAVMRDFVVTVPRDCVASQTLVRNRLVLRQLEDSTTFQPRLHHVCGSENQLGKQ
jgi:nicotinamidase-related amidase